MIKELTQCNENNHKGRNHKGDDGPHNLKLSRIKTSFFTNFDLNLIEIIKIITPPSYEFNMLANIDTDD